MSEYQTIADLTGNSFFVGRVQACTVEQAQIFINDERADIVALSRAMAQGLPDPLFAMVRLIAAGPGVADAARTNNGTDQSLVTDAMLLSHTQANWPLVAGLYFDETGSPLPPLTGIVPAP